MARPPKEARIPFNLLFPMLVYYFAQVQDREMGGEWDEVFCWDKICELLDTSEAIALPLELLDSLIYTFKMGVLDQRQPFKHLHKFRQKNYRPLLLKLKEYDSSLFKEDQDGEILMIGKLSEVVSKT